jgi:hypothetical protein
LGKLNENKGIPQSTNAYLSLGFLDEVAVCSNKGISHSCVDVCGEGRVLDKLAVQMGSSI